MDKKVFGQNATWAEFEQASGAAGFTTAGGLCAFLKISRGTLSNWKTGRTKINIDSFNELVELASRGGEKDEKKFSKGARSVS